jgi:hypothetical protein
MDSRTGKVFGVILGLLASVCIYFGSGMLLVPGGPGEPYLDWFRVAYGISPAISGIILIVLAAWLWRRGESAVMGARIRVGFNFVVGGVVLFWIVLVVIAHLQGRIP